MNSSSDFGVRDGEVTVDLPAQPDAGVYFIGRIRTPWQDRKSCPKNARESDAVCTVELEDRYVPALKEVETCSHLVLLYWMDKAPRNLVRQVPGHYGVQRGTFALRSPARPNPIAMSVVKLTGIDGIPNWNFYVVFSFFRLAAILQGVLKRALDGNASSKKALGHGALAKPLSEMALQLIS